MKEILRTRPQSKVYKKDETVCCANAVNEATNVNNEVQRRVAKQYLLSKLNDVTSTMRLHSKF